MVFDGPISTYIAVTVASGIAIVFTLLSQRSAKRKLTVVLFNLLWLVTFVLFLYPPPLPDVAEGAILVTPGIQTADLKTTSSDRVFFLNNLNEGFTPNAMAISDLSVFNRHYPEISHLRIFGGGLPKEQWSLLEGVSGEFFDNEIPAGIILPRWSRRIELGDNLIIEGTLAGREITRVNLIGPFGASLESFSAGQGDVFRFETTPKAIGNYVYQLEFEGQGQKLNKEPIPVVVQQPIQTTIAIYSSAPNFETNYLKRWATDGGIAIFLKTKISKSKYKEEWINTEKKLSPGDWDLLVTDLRSWSELDEKESELLLSRVRQGMGLLFMPGKLKSVMKIADYFEVESSKPRVVAYDRDGDVIELRTGPIRFVQQPEAADILIQEGALATHTKRVEFGRGYMGMTLIANSHLLATHGMTVDYGRYWQEVLSRLLAQRTVRERLIPTNPIPYVDRRLSVCLESDAAHVQLNRNDQASLPLTLTQLDYRDDLRCGYFWPKQAGWYKVVTNDGEYPIYVFNHDAFGAERQRIASLETRLFVAVGEANTSPRRSLLPRAAPRLWFFLPLLLIAAVLWWEQRVWSRP